MKKRIGMVLLVLVILMSLIMGFIPAQASEGTITLRVHYYRKDGNYDRWRVFFCDEGAIPTFEWGYYYFQPEGEEMVATIHNIPSDTASVYYSITKPFDNMMCVEYPIYPSIDLGDIVSGTLDIYVKAHEEGHEIVYGEDVVRGIVVVNATYKENGRDGFPQIIVKMSGNMDDYGVTTDTFSVHNQDEQITVTAVKTVNNYCYLTLSEPLDPMGGCTAGFKDKTTDILVKEATTDPTETTTAPTEVATDPPEATTAPTEATTDPPETTTSQPAEDVLTPPRINIAPLFAGLAFLLAVVLLVVLLWKKKGKET